jgi:sulfite reductase beta subunit-like hemoprotein
MSCFVFDIVRETDSVPRRDAEVRTALAAHAGRVARYRAGRLSDEEFRPVRLSYGLYYQLDHTSHMQRIKLPGGVITAPQVDALADLADDYARGVLHMTTRQDVQLHWIDLGDVVALYDRLHSVGISTRGACSDSVRNITGCIHAGTWPSEPFDVTPYVMAVDQYFLFHPLNLTLPRKFKIGFSGCEADCAQARVNDIAFFPKVRTGRAGFAVYAGGGLGSQPFLARPVRDFVPAQDLLLIADAIVRLQHRHGERKNRKKARMKYVVQRMGAAGFTTEVDRLVDHVEREQGDALREELQALLAAYRPPQPARPPGAWRAGGGEAWQHWVRTNVYAQAQTGYYGATVQLPLGDITSAQFRAVGQLASDLGAGVVRATNDQNLMVPWLPGDALETFYAGLRDVALAEADALHITDVTSCPGADFCSLAVSRSMGMAAALRRHLVSSGTAIEDLGVFRIKISGCPNSCGQHHIGDIGLTGMSLKGSDGQHRVHYSVLLGGRVGEETARVGHRLAGRFPEEEVPALVTALAAFYRSARAAGEHFGDFVERVGGDRLNAVAGAAAPEAR